MADLRKAMKLLQANRNKLGNFIAVFPPALQIAVNCIFLANCQFILPWLKILKLNVMLKEATAGNDWIVKWEQCVEAPKKEIGSCLRNEAKESHVNSVIENCLY